MTLRISQSEPLSLSLLVLPLSPSSMISFDTLFSIPFSYDIEVDDEGLDPEIELEMEAFIDEIEEHLMMRDFDPDLDHSQR